MISRQFVKGTAIAIYWLSIPLIIANLVRMIIDGGTDAIFLSIIIASMSFLGIRVLVSFLVVGLLIADKKREEHFRDVKDKI